MYFSIDLVIVVSFFVIVTLIFVIVVSFFVIVILIFVIVDSIFVITVSVFQIHKTKKGKDKAFLLNQNIYNHCMYNLESFPFKRNRKKNHYIMVTRLPGPFFPSKKKSVKVCETASVCVIPSLATILFPLFCKAYTCTKVLVAILNVIFKKIQMTIIRLKQAFNVFESSKHCNKYCP